MHHLGRENDLDRHLVQERRVIHLGQLSDGPTCSAGEMAVD